MDIEILNSISNIKLHKKNINKNDCDIKLYLNTIAALSINKNDINFLTHLLKQKQSKSNIITAATLIGFAVVCFLTLYLYQYFINKNSLVKQIEELDKQLTSQRNLETISEVRKMEKILNALREYKDLVVYLTLSIEDVDNVKTKLLEDISKAIPIDTTINSLSINNDTIYLQGQAFSRTSIAQLEKNLRQIDYFDEIHVPVINGSESMSDTFTFTLTCNIKDVTNDEVE